MEIGTISGYISEDIKYCPYCGARLDGREKAKVPVTVLHTPIMPKVEKKDDDKWHYVFNTLADWIREDDRRTEQQIFKEIADWATEHNISTVYLIDEEFVKTALLNEIERRNNL